MLPHEYDTMRSVEDDHWWYRVLRGLACQETAAQGSASQTSPTRILDAGCGTGGTMAALRDTNPGWQLEGFDYSDLAVSHARNRGFTQVCKGSVNSVPFAEHSQDIVISLDVLCCGGVDPLQAMREFHRVLVPTGTLILNLPAYQCLRGRHDIAVNSVRRFTPAEVLELHRSSGFTVERLFCWNACLFAPLVLWRQASRGLAGAASSGAKSDLATLHPAVNRFLSFLVRREASLCRAIRCPVGTSVFSAARAAKGR